MQTQAKPILGEITAFTLTSPDLEKSLAFYKQLGFSEVGRSDWPFPWIQVSDGAILMMIRQGNEPYIALTYYVRDINSVVSMLEKKGIEFSSRPKAGDMIQRYVTTSPDGLNVSLVGVVEGFAQPPGPTMLAMDQADYFNPEKYVNKTCGMFGEFAHPVANLEQSLAFWEKLGFHSVSKFTSPYPWAIISDGLSVVGLHQSKHFGYPAITYFAADMQNKIAKLKDAGLTEIKEQGPANAVVTTPEQQHIFLYKLGM
jgi:catechol 2,3-dioxygenase-like lactoylglutathione lyase family enzyme